MMFQIIRSGSHVSNFCTLISIAISQNPKPSTVRTYYRPWSLGVTDWTTEMEAPAQSWPDPHTPSNTCPPRTFHSTIIHQTLTQPDCRPAVYKLVEGAYCNPWSPSLIIYWYLIDLTDWTDFLKLELVKCPLWNMQWFGIVAPILINSKLLY